LADNQQSRMELGYVPALDSRGRTIWIVEAHRGDGRRFGCEFTRIADRVFRIPTGAGERSSELILKSNRRSRLRFPTLVRSGRRTSFDGKKNLIRCREGARQLIVSLARLSLDPAIPTINYGLWLSSRPGGDSDPKEHRCINEEMRTIEMQERVGPKTPILAVQPVR